MTKLVPIMLVFVGAKLLLAIACIPLQAASAPREFVIGHAARGRTLRWSSHTSGIADYDTVLFPDAAAIERWQRETITPPQLVALGQRLEGYEVASIDGGRVTAVGPHADLRAAAQS